MGTNPVLYFSLGNEDCNFKNQGSSAPKEISIAGIHKYTYGLSGRNSLTTSRPSFSGDKRGQCGRVRLGDDSPGHNHEQRARCEGRAGGGALDFGTQNLGFIG